MSDFSSEEQMVAARELIKQKYPGQRLLRGGIPRVPTEAMIEAGVKALKECQVTPQDCCWAEVVLFPDFAVKTIYLAMIEASEHEREL